MSRLFHFLILGAVLLLARPVIAENPPAPGFDLAGSDTQAIAIADQVMERLGGRAAWDNTHYVTWRFFGNRRHVWDKFTGDIRIEGTDRETKKPYLILMNLHTKEGRVWSDGEELSDPEVVAERLEYGESVWINDSYWIFMPFKLKDTGVTLKSLGEKTMQDGRPAQVLQLTFEGVGRTPENKYYVYVADDSGLVEQWDFFDSADQSEPRFQNPWHNWQTFGRILLSDNRGENGHSDIAVFSELPAAVLNSPEPIDWDALIP